jgi:hypothetical protein
MVAQPGDVMIEELGWRERDRAGGTNRVIAESHAPYRAVRAGESCAHPSGGSLK